ncbi:MAG: acyl carrier protein [Burkholderiaceae bacterium]|nr:acyl carrier protein [Burkholderiaceae bacterium]
MTRNDFITAVIAFLVETTEKLSIDITPDTDLIETGVVDSFSITQLILFIEDTLDIEISLDDPNLDSIRTVRRIDMTYNVKAA